MTKANKCPACGCEPEVLGGDGGAWVECSNSECALSGHMGTTIKNGILIWNNIICGD